MTRIRRLPPAWLSFVICWALMAYGSVVGAQDDLPGRVRAARNTFQPRSQSDLDEARAHLNGVVAALDRYLRRGGANAAAWKRYLRWQDLSGELARVDGPPDMGVLGGVLAQFRSGERGLELDVFHNVTAALESYLAVAASLSNPELQTQFDTAIEALASSLESYAANPAADVLNAGVALDWLARHGQAEQVVNEVRGEISRPNLFVEVSETFITEGSSRSIDEVAPVKDVILGTRISGSGHTIGKVNMRLIPDPNRAALETVLTGTNDSRTIGRNGPARIHTSGSTRLEGRKRIWIDADGVHSAGATAAARTRTLIRGVSSTRRHLADRIIRRVAWKRIPKQKAQSERIAGLHAERQLERRLDAEAGKVLLSANRRWTQRLRGSPIRMVRVPRRLRFSTTESALTVVGAHEGAQRLAAPTAPPEITGTPGVALRLHQSFVNNVAADALSGVTLSDADLDRMAKQVLGHVPPELLEDDDEPPWSITFAQVEPVHLETGDGTVALTIRGQRYTRGSQRYDGMDVTARYQLDGSGKVARAVRQGDLEIFPPGFVPGGGRTIPLRLQTLRNLLKHRFDKIFAPEIVSPGIALRGGWSRGSTLELTQLRADRGWLVLDWQQRDVERPGNAVGLSWLTRPRLHVFPSPAQREPAGS